MENVQFFVIQNLKIADVQKYMLDMFQGPERFLLLFDPTETLCLVVLQSDLLWVVLNLIHQNKGKDQNPKDLRVLLQYGPQLKLRVLQTWRKDQNRVGWRLVLLV